MQRKLVLTVGGALIDTIALIDSERIERMSMNNADKAYLLLEEGRKTEASLVSTHAGGGAVNAAVCFARLGFDVSILIKIGEDQRGEAIKRALQNEGISAQCILVTADSATGASVIISSHEKNAAIFTFRGANSLIRSQEIVREWLQRDLVYIAGLSNGSADVFPKLVDEAHANGAFVAANPGIRQLAARGDAFQKTVSKLSLLSMNRDEASSFIPRLSAIVHPQTARPSKEKLPELMRRGFSASGFDMSLPQFFAAMLKLGPKCVLLTDGKQGAYAADASGTVYCPAMRGEVVGTAGAGDAFTATFAAYYGSGVSIDDAIKLATMNANSVVMHADTQTGLMTRAALEASIAGNPGALTLRRWSC